MARKPPPKERQFGQPNGNPRNPGGWKKEDTARYKLEKMLVMTDSELEDIMRSAEAPTFEKRAARVLLNGDREDLKFLIHEAYGTPTSNVTISAPPVKLVEFGDLLETTER